MLKTRKLGKRSVSKRSNSSQELKYTETPNNMLDTLSSIGLSRNDISSLIGGFRSEIKSGYRGNLMGWAIRYFNRYLTKPPSPMHAWLAEELGHFAGMRGQRRCTIGPRGSAKSTWVSLIYPLYCALEGTEKYIILASDTESQSSLLLANIKTELTNNPLIMSDYSAVAGEGPVWRSDRIVLRNGTMIECLGSGSKIRGRRHEEARPSLIIVDDPENDDHIVSPSQREAVKGWFNRALLKAGNTDTNVWVIGTALHRDCLVMSLLVNPGWKCRTFKAIERWPDRMDLWAQWEEIYNSIHREDRAEAAERFYTENKERMHEGAKILWPEEENLLTLMKMRIEGGKAAFESEKQGNPIDPSLCEWPAEYFSGDIWFDVWPRDLAIKVIALDPSKGRSSHKNDYTAMVKIGVDKKAFIYVEAKITKIPTPDIVAEGIEWYKEFIPDAFVIEANQWQELLCQDFLDGAKEQSLLIPFYAVEDIVQKQVRIRRVGPYLSLKRLRFKMNSPGTAMLIDQLKDFPNGAHDDGPDALEIGIRTAAQLIGPRSDGLGSRLAIEVP